MLKACQNALWSEYDVALLDLDGVVYIGPDAVPGAPEHIARSVAAGMRVAYVTNNAARPPAAVAQHLRELGIDAADDDVVTSAQAAAALLAGRCDQGAAVFVIGGAGLFQALAERDLRPVQSAEDGPVAVVSGYHRELRWGTVSDGAILVRGGLPWVAANTDMSVPTPAGHGPGNGVIVEAVARFADRTPVVAGKPQPPLLEEAVRRVGGSRPLVVGDRLDTDIEGAVNTGYDSLLVLTGVTDLEELVAAPRTRRPSYLAGDLAALGEAQPAPQRNHQRNHQSSDRRDGGGWGLGGWSVTATGGVLAVSGDGDPDDWWRTVAAAAWEHLDTTGSPVRTEEVTPPPHRVGPRSNPGPGPAPDSDPTSRTETAS